MNEPEFQRWFDHFAAAFPAAKDFVRKYDPTGKATLTRWFEVLKTRELADALAVTNGMFEGALAALPGSDRGFPDWSQVPRHVSRLCGEMHPIEPEWRQHTVRNRSKVGLIQGDKSMTEAFQGTQKILGEGGTMDEVRSYLDDYYGCKQSPAASRDRGNFTQGFDQFNRDGF